MQLMRNGLALCLSSTLQFAKTLLIMIITVTSGLCAPAVGLVDGPLAPVFQLLVLCPFHPSSLHVQHILHAWHCSEGLIGLIS